MMYRSHQSTAYQKEALSHKSGLIRFFDYYKDLQDSGKKDEYPKCHFVTEEAQNLYTSIILEKLYNLKILADTARNIIRWHWSAHPSWQLSLIHI